MVQLIDRNGNVVNNYEYDKWGNFLSNNETISNPFKYAGEIFDEETGLYYLRVRYYDPKDGRFINEDSFEGTVTNPLTLNVYSYVSNNPLLYIDPSGNIKLTQYTKLFSGTMDGITGLSGLLNFFSPDMLKGLVELGKAIANGYIEIKQSRKLLQSQHG